MRKEIRKIDKEIKESFVRVQNEKENKRKINDLCNFKAREMFSYMKSHDEIDFDDAYKTRWA